MKGKLWQNHAVTCWLTTLQLAHCCTLLIFTQHGDNCAGNYSLARVINVRPAGSAHHLQQICHRVVIGALAVGTVIVLGTHDDYQVGW